MFSSTMKVSIGFVGVMASLAAASSNDASKRATDPTDYSWIKKFAAVGDSFTAGIGSGDLYSETDNSYTCSRYDYTYPVLMNNVFGSTVDQFTYTACSGAISTGIYEQINALDDDMDLVVLTAGGNDLCLSSIIDNCIAGLAPSDSKCTAAVTKAQDGLTSYFKDNIKELLVALDGKMATNGIVVMVLYAQYFNDQTDACDTENWQVISLPTTGLSLTTARRTIFNNLVNATNTALQEVIDDVASTATTMTLVSANWDSWAPIIGGQFCEDGANPNPYVSDNSNLMFFKLNTGTRDNGGGELRRRSDLDMYYNDNNASLPFELYEMQKRDPTDPGCPSSSIPLPDSIGKLFHPSGLGHEVIAAYALDAVADARATILGDAANCPVVDTLTCYSTTGSTSYASAESLNNNIDAFCSYVAKDPPSASASKAKTYYTGSLDEYTMSVSLSDVAETFSKDACVTAIGNIVNGCDVPTSTSNLMNWKSGGKKVEGEFTYEVSVYRTNRPWPPPSAPTQSCAGWYKFLFQSYDIYGAGWATYDFGQKTLSAQVNPCCGSGSLTGWTFKYFDEPDENGYEWHAFFHTAIGTRRRCFDNNKVQCAAGGPCDSFCKGNG